MSSVPFFTEGLAADAAYRNIMAGADNYLVAARTLCTRLWDEFEPYADNDFLTEVRTRFDERFWEMYLTVALKSLGYDVTCPKPGPDVGIIHDGMRIWFEAVSPSRGSDGSPDQVPEWVTGTVQDVPNQKLVLRYLNSISEKYERQFPGWLASGIVGESDAFVIALNPRRLGFEYADTHPPRILQAAYPLGDLYMTIDRQTLEATGSGYQYRSQLSKSSGSLVDTGVFLREGYERLSGLLVSRVDAANTPHQLGGDFQLAPNPVAKASLPDTFRLPGTYYGAASTDDGFVVTPDPPEEED